MESFSREYYKENKILSLKFKPVWAKQTSPNYGDGGDQDETEIQYDRLCTRKWYNCEKHQKCDKYEKCAVTKFRHLKFKPSCSGNFCYGI